VFCLLLVSIGVWHFWISGYSGWVMVTFGTQTDVYLATHGLLPDVGRYGVGLNMEEFLDVHSREPAIAKALGMTAMTIPETVEVVANWVVVGAITLGLWLLLKSKQIDDVFKIMGVSLWGLIICTVAIPWLSQFYGGMRVYFTTLPVLSLGLPVGMKWVGGKVRAKTLVLCGIVLALLAVSTSGLVYKPFEEAKTFPVYWQVENLEGK